MKMHRVILQVIVVFALMLTGGPLPLLHIESSHAMGYIPKDHRSFHHNGGGPSHQVPEPSVLVMLGTGMGGVGILYAFARRNRKK